MPTPPRASIADFSSPSRMSTEVTLDFDAAPGAVSASAVAASGQSQVIPIPRPSNLKAPNELGVAPSNNDDGDYDPANDDDDHDDHNDDPSSSLTATNTDKTAKATDKTATTTPSKKPVATVMRDETAARQRSAQLMKLVTANAAANETTIQQLSQRTDGSSSASSSSLVCALAHRGMEVVLCAMGTQVAVVCSRTRALLQILPGTRDAICAMEPNPVTSEVVVADVKGTLRLHRPQKTDPTLVPFGRYRWNLVRQVDSSSIFGVLPDQTFAGAMISTSADGKILVSLNDQVAIFEEEHLVWTTKLDAAVVSSNISGDGRAVVVVVEGEGVKNANPFGARTFIRDGEDGNTNTAPQRPGTSRNVSNVSNAGLVYKPGPFLVHTASVSTLSFRGLGQRTSEVHKAEEEGNDLLLTYCEDDSSVRIFSQNSWKQLKQWTTPPQTRADWVRGLSAFNLGDLDSGKSRKTTSSRVPSRRPSGSSDNDDEQALHMMHARPAHPTPSSAAGAWIAEITFRSAFPALRLSRLSYMKNGGLDGAQPAHFESVAAILPAGSVSANSVLGGESARGICFQGIWPAWDPWTSDGNASELTESGSAMSFLGLTQSTNGYFGDHHLGGTHTPPSELRLVASHPKTGHVVMMEFPLWGDQDLGGMELGSPLRYLLALSEAHPFSNSDDNSDGGNSQQQQLISCLDYESSILCARLEEDAKSVAVTWRKQGSLSLLPEPSVVDPAGGLLGYSIDDSDDSHHYHRELFPSDKPELFRDLSVVPVPLSIPPMRLPPNLEEDKIVVMKWWPDENYGGPPQLFCATKEGTLFVYEMPPPWCSLEPTMPSYDPFQSTTALDAASVDRSGHDDQSDDGSTEPKEYEVMITPNPDFGIGLRLEAQLDGMPAIAGSYKKHPLNGGTLPAEKTGMIVLGDELLSVNGASLEGLTFDDIIATVRRVGAEAPPASPLCMRFRPVAENRVRANSSAFSLSNDMSVTEHSGNVNRRQIFGTTPKSLSRKSSAGASAVSSENMPANNSTVVIGSEGQVQQEFSRIVAAVSKQLPKLDDEHAQSQVLLLPWVYGAGASNDTYLRGRALLVVASGSTLYAKRLEVAGSCDPDEAKCTDLGSITLRDKKDNITIESLQSLRSGSEASCINVCDSHGHTNLVFIDVEEKGSSLTATFGHFPMAAPAGEGVMIRSNSVEIMATMPRACGQGRKVTVWKARPDARLQSAEEKKESEDSSKGSHMYTKSFVCLDDADIPSDDRIVDYRFVSSGYLDAFPWIVVFTTGRAVVYRRAGGKLRWSPLVILQYPETLLGVEPVRFRAGALSPPDQYPHITQAVRMIVSHCDEVHHMQSDWHPDSLLSYICSNEGGAKHALRTDIKNVFEWLSKWTDPRNDTEPIFNEKSRLCITPLEIIDKVPDVQEEEEEEEEEEDKNETAASLFASSALSKKEPKPRDEALEMLQRVLRPSAGADEEEKKEDEPPKLPAPLQKLNRDQIRFLWAMGQLIRSRPKFNKIDKEGQLALFCVAILRQLKCADNDSEEEEKITDRRRNSTKQTQSSYVAHFQKRPSLNLELEQDDVSQMAPSGCISALLSNHQNALLEACRKSPGEKFDWGDGRCLRLPFWIRSDEKLKKLSEEIGQAVFQKTRDVMECALFFIIAGNMKMLRNLAAADRNLSGSKFFKFISDHDFRSDRGRRAAEKNAYSLLGKHKYNVAASFFLLAEPPLMKSALETLLVKSGDLDLAFMVARLMESSVRNANQTKLALSMMGGGGGFASGGMSSSTPQDEVETAFKSWQPKLGTMGRWCLRERGLEKAKGDSCLRSVQFLWLDLKEEAGAALADCTGRADDFEVISDMIFPTSFDTPISDNKEKKPAKGKNFFHFHAPREKTAESANSRVLKKTNNVLDFVARPFLAKSMGSSYRSVWATTLLTSRAMLRRGIELSAVRCILHTTDKTDYDEKAETPSSSSSSKTAGSKMNGSAPSVARMQSSIFDLFDAAPPKPAKKESPIFDDVVPAPQGKSKKENPQSGEMSSSIFDSFDPPTTKPKPQSGGMTSSIFDSFDVEPPKPKQPAVSQVAEMSSSIFDGFDAAPPKPKPQVQSQSGEMTSSIFDGFDAAPPKKVSHSPGGAMQSSIFDSFDVTPRNNQKASAKSNHSSYVPPSHEVSTKAPINGGTKDDEGITVPLVSLPAPDLWLEWRKGILIRSAARRLIREVARYVEEFHGDSVSAPMDLFRRHAHPLIPPKSAEVLQSHCDGDTLIDKVKQCLQSVCGVSKIEEDVIVGHALNILEGDLQPARIVLVVLLCVIDDRTDLAEDIIRDASIALIQRCEALVLANDDLSYKRNTRYHEGSQYLRRLVSTNSWQLELCLWLHRGGVVPLSGLVLKEATAAVRAGLALASWGRNHECLEAMMRYEPDCPLQHEAGRQLWSSMKMIAGLEDLGQKKVGASSSGGWEFLVDCRRDEATKMLRKRKPGSFIIRPHPDDNGVFTLSFKTNLRPAERESDKESTKSQSSEGAPRKTKPVKKDDVVQHAIIRLSDAGFRCGSFGPYTTLMQLLEAVSASLPFNLLFDKPPTEGIIKEEDSQPSPNAFFLRKFAMTSHTDKFRWQASTNNSLNSFNEVIDKIRGMTDTAENQHLDEDHLRRFGVFAQLLALSQIRKQLSSIAAADYNTLVRASSAWDRQDADDDGFDSVESLSLASPGLGVEERYAVAARIVRPFLAWTRAEETRAIFEIAPAMEEIEAERAQLGFELEASEGAIEMSPVTANRTAPHRGDSMIRQMIQPESGVQFRTLRVGEGSDSAMIVLFSRIEALAFLTQSGTASDEAEAVAKLEEMENRRVIETIALSDLHLKALQHPRQNEDPTDVTCFRFVDPWEVESLESRQGETKAAALGREHYLAFKVSVVAAACEATFRKLGGLHLLGLWSNAKGGLRLTKAIASVHAPWERDAGGDLPMSQGNAAEQSLYINSIRQHLYRNAVFRRLRLPQRFVALVQVELLDLKTLTSPSVGNSLSVYALLRLKRNGSNAPLSHKARTLDSAATATKKIVKSSGPNAPASWGSLVRFRFPLPEDVNCDGVSVDEDREALFKGPPSILQLAVYEKKFMSDILLGGADIKLDGLKNNGQLEEWVPLKSSKDNINWFARIRLTLRFELMCLPSEDSTVMPPSVGLRKIQYLSKIGGTHEDKVKRTASTQDLLSYFEGMIY